MRVYIDLCCLRRPFDLQEQPIVRLRTEAVLSLLALPSQTLELLAKGFKSFDAFHLASAELAGAAVFLTVDLPLLRLASRVSGELRVQVTDPVHFIEEISQWKH